MVPLLMVLLVWSIAGKIITGYFGARLYGLSKKCRCGPDCLLPSGENFP